MSATGGNDPLANWSPAEFLIATAAAEPEIVAGYAYRGLGMHFLKWPSRHWELIHLNTGHVVMHVFANAKRAFPIAAKIADMIDWDFDGLDGWRNRDPNLRENLRQIIADSGGVLGWSQEPKQWPDQARAIMLRRMQ